MINKYFLAKMNIPAYLKKFLYNRYGYNEIEGIPPIIFKGNGKKLLDYRIFGASRRSWRQDRKFVLWNVGK